MSKKIGPKELATCANCSCFNTRMASPVVTQIYDEIMHETGLRGTQFTILAMVAGYQSLTISLLAKSW